MKKDNKPYDSAFKDLAEQDPEGLLLLIGALPPGARIKALPREVTRPALLPDQPYEVISAAAHFVTHIEAQTRYEPPVPDRFVDYGAQLWLKYRLPVHCYLLVYLPRGMPADAPTSATVIAGGVKITVEYIIVRLWELQAEAVLQLNRVSLLPFVPLMKGNWAQVEEGARRLQTVPDEARRRELALHFVVLSGLRYDRTDVLELLGRKNMIPWETLKESSIIQWVMEESHKEGLERGHEEGIKEGIKEGEQQGRRKELLRLLERGIAHRFPGFETAVEAERISDLEALEDLLLNLGEVPDAATLRARLQAAGGDAPRNGVA